MSLLQAPAETFNFMVLGFSVILGLLSLYVLSLAVRFRNSERDLELLEGVEVEEDSTS